MYDLRRKPVVWLLASLTVVFVLATVLLAVVYGDRRGDHNEQRAAAADQQVRIDELSGDIGKARQDLARVQGDLRVSADLPGSPYLRPLIEACGGAESMERRTVHLGIDFGTSNTVAMISVDGGRPRPLLLTVRRCCRRRCVRSRPDIC